MGSKSSKSASPVGNVACPSTLQEFDSMPPEQRHATFDALVAQFGGTSATSEGGTWAEYENIDMSHQGDAKIIGDWKENTTLEDMKKIVEKNNWSAITVSNGKPSFGHAALKNFDFPLTPDMCMPISSSHKHPCKIYIYTPPAAAAKKGKAPETKKIPADTTAKRLALVKAGSPEQCVFEHADKLAAGEEIVPLTLKNGQAIVAKQPGIWSPAHYHLITPGVGKADVAIRACLDKEGFLTLEDIEFVLDVDKWNYCAGNKLWLLREHDDPRKPATRRSDGGRSFKMNKDGTMSPVKAPNLVLGIPSADESKAEVDYKEADVPADFPLPTNGQKFTLTSTLDGQDKVLEIFCHNTNCPLVLSHCCTPGCAHWYVSEVDKEDGAFRLSIDTAQGKLNARLGVAQAGESMSAVKGDGTWLLAEKQSTDRIRLKTRFGTFFAGTEKKHWGGRHFETTEEVGDGSTLIVKHATVEEE